jgi:pyruvate dehydrogenase E1 component alpha subunit
MQLSREEMLRAYRRMYTIRAFEERVMKEFAAGNIPGFAHVYLGQEASGVGVCHDLTDEDYIGSTHRGHGHCIDKGVDVKGMMIEIFGKSGGLCGGKGGSMHIADFSVGMLGANGVVCAGLPIACGAAHALKLQGKPDIVACFFGDGAANRGPFLEALTWACVYELPVLFVCEDNRWSATTRTGPLTGGPGIAARATAIGVPASTVDGNDVEAVSAMARRLTEEMRTKQGPRFLHATTLRVRGHLSADKQGYRDPSDIEAAVAADPLALARSRLIERDRLNQSIDAIDAEVAAEVTAAFAFADASPAPDAATAYQDVQTLGAGTWH